MVKVGVSFQMPFKKKERKKTSVLLKPCTPSFTPEQVFIPVLQTLENKGL